MLQSSNGLNIETDFSIQTTVLKYDTSAYAGLKEDFEREFSDLEFAAADKATVLYVSVPLYTYFSIVAIYVEKNDDLTSESMYSLTLLNEHLVEKKTASYMAGMQAFYTTTKGTYLGMALST